jgi:hypothetical protein
MTTPTSIIYTREDLKGLRAERDRQIHEQNVNRLVEQISQRIIATAQTNNDNNAFYQTRQLESNTNDPEYRVVMDAIETLKTRFIGVSIEYKFQTDIRTGRKFNHGVYIDWS